MNIPSPGQVGEDQAEHFGGEVADRHPQGTEDQLGLGLPELRKFDLV